MNEFEKMLRSGLQVKFVDDDATWVDSGGKTIRELTRTELVHALQRVRDAMEDLAGYIAAKRIKERNVAAMKEFDALMEEQ